MKEVIMKKLVLAPILFFVFGSLIVFCQENPQPPFSWKMDKIHQASGLFASKTYDEVWLVVKKYLQTKATILSSDKETGIIATTLDNAKFFIETKPEGISVNIASEYLKGQYSFKAKAEYKAIYQSIAVDLYGPDVIKKKGKNK
jgi:hypothetical protein